MNVRALTMLGEGLLASGSDDGTIKVSGSQGRNAGMQTFAPNRIYALV